MTEISDLVKKESDALSVESKLGVISEGEYFKRVQKVNHVGHKYHGGIEEFFGIGVGLMLGVMGTGYFLLGSTDPGPSYHEISGKPVLVSKDVRSGYELGISGGTTIISAICISNGEFTILAAYLAVCGASYVAGKVARKAYDQFVDMSYQLDKIVQDSVPLLEGSSEVEND